MAEIIIRLQAKLYSWTQTKKKKTFIFIFKEFE